MESNCRFETEFELPIRPQEFQIDLPVAIHEEDIPAVVTVLGDMAWLTRRDDSC